MIDPVPAEDSAAETERREFDCASCGSMLHYAPGTSLLRCTHCGAENEIPVLDVVIHELDYETHLARLEQEAPAEEKLTVRCGGCGAQVDKAAEATALECPYCASPLVATAASTRQLKPRSLLPFKLERRTAHGKFRQWVKGLWLAPNDLAKSVRDPERMRAIYVPYWTFDAFAETDYRGERGDDYWTTETYWTTNSEGKSVMRTRQVRRTRWSPAQGRVHNRFDDLLVLASPSIPSKQAHALAPWDLHALVPYQDAWLAGFLSESYQVGLEQGLRDARLQMEGPIRNTIRRDIGGDHQRIHQMQVALSEITFKHILLPLWISSYRYRGRVFRFLVNARTGEVQGERPYSAWKIALLVLLGLLVAGGVWFWSQHQ